MRRRFSALSWKLIKTVLFVFCSFICPEKGKLFGMGDNRENQLGINQRGKSEEPVSQVPFPTRIHFSKAAKPVRVSCGAFHSAVLTGKSVDMNFISCRCPIFSHSMSQVYCLFSRLGVSLLLVLIYKLRLL